ncbi:hypothetical protein [Chamaesiphon minutus]|nr:hypothetical protein [Chamaesiphon minutus]
MYRNYSSHTPPDRVQNALDNKLQSIFDRTNDFAKDCIHVSIDGVF